MESSALMSEAAPGGIRQGADLPGASEPDPDRWQQTPPVDLSDGTRIWLYKDGQALRAAYDAIKSARRLICLEVYIFRSDSTGRAFADLLCEKARQGIRVFVIYDSFGSWDSDAAIFTQMKSAGVRLQTFHPLQPWECKFGWRPANRDHRKLLLIDNEIAGMGGLNIGAEYAGSSIISSETCENWRDNAIGIVGPGARQLAQSFKQSWNYVNHGGRIRRAELIHNIDTGELGLLASVPTLRSPLLPFLHRLFEQSRKSIQLTMAYFAPDDPLIEELCAAARRGVRVRLMLPGKCDIKLLQVAARSFYETLLTNGVKVFERQGAMLHAKTMTIDDEVTVIGSVNLDYRSIEYNLELSSIIRNRPFALQMRSLFENDVRHADRITLENWRYRPTWDRFVQWAVSRVRYLL
jgi:cardiolipin synthase